MTVRLVGRGLAVAAIVLLVAGLRTASAHPQSDWMGQQTEYCAADAAHCADLVHTAGLLTGLGLLTVVVAVLVLLIGRTAGPTSPAPATAGRITACVALALLVLAGSSGLFAVAFVMVGFGTSSSTAELALLGLGWLFSVLAVDGTIRAFGVVRPRPALVIAAAVVTTTVGVAGVVVFGRAG